MSGPDSKRRAEGDQSRGEGRDLLYEREWNLITDDLELSPRESEVVKQLFAQHTERRIARELGISRHTVHSHLRRIYRKLDVRSRTALLLEVFSALLGELHPLPSCEGDAP